MKLGTNYGGWDLPYDARLDSQSIVYSGGVGEDISFDLLLKTKHDCHLFLIDPTKKQLHTLMKLKKHTLLNNLYFLDQFNQTIYLSFNLSIQTLINLPIYP